MPGFTTLAQYILAAASATAASATTASADRSALFHLFFAVFEIARATVSLVVKFYKANERALTPGIVARLHYCAVRLKAVWHTLQHAPQRFLSPAQLRALTRARAVLAHVTRQPVDFTPLAPLLAPLANRAPALPRANSTRSTPDPNLYRPVDPGQGPLSLPSHSSSPRSPISAPRSTPLSASSSANPLLLRAPGCALASVLLHLAAIYRVPASPPLAPQSTSSAPAPSPSAQPTEPSIPHTSNPSDRSQPSTSNAIDPPQSISPPSAFHAPP